MSLFVSHAANVSNAKLKGVDLLPKLKNKTLVTKELSPIFRGREEEMQENFSVLIAVLDGKGFVSDSGAKGHRGYEENIIFNWLGATTPLPPKTHRMMYQLGTRLLFYETPSVEPTEDALLAYAERDDANEAETECRFAVNLFLIDFFDQHPIGSVLPESIRIPTHLLLELSRWALLVTHGRTEIKHEKKGGEWEPVSASRPEGPWKLVNYFKELVRGHALIHGREEVTAADIELVSKVALSSIPINLRPIVFKLRRTRSITSTECSDHLNVSKPTAIRYLTELDLTGIGVLEKGSATDNRPDTLTVSAKFSWLAATTPLTTNEGCGMEGGESKSPHRGHSALRGIDSGQKDLEFRCCTAEPPAKETGH